MVVVHSLIVYLAKSLYRRQNHRKGIANTKPFFLFIALKQKKKLDFGETKSNRRRYSIKSSILAAGQNGGTYG